MPCRYSFWWSIKEWVTRYYGAPPPTPEVAKEEPAKVPVTEPAAPAQRAQSGQPVEVPVGREAKEVRVETDNYIALFTNQGARLKSFKFKKYRASVAENSPPFEIISSAPGVPFPLGVQWQTPAPFDDSGLLYSVQGGDQSLTGDAKGTLIFKGQTGDGTVITQGVCFFRFDLPDSIGGFGNSCRWQGADA